MKNQTLCLWALIIAFLAVSCVDGKKSDLSTGVIQDTIPQPCLSIADSTDGNIDAAKKSLQGKRLKQLRSKTLVVIHREQWVERKGSEAKAIEFVKKMTDNVAARKLAKYNVIDEFDFVISKPAEFPKTGTTSTYNTLLRQKYTRARAHKILFVGWGNNGGIAIQSGGGVPGSNYASVIITDGNAAGGYQENDINHELFHLDGVPHSHQYIHTINGEKFQALENYGQVYFPNVAGALRGNDIKNPKIGGQYAKSSATSYEASKFLPYSLDLHPDHVPLYLEKVASYTDAYNTAENLRYENGAITYDDEFHGTETYQVRIGTFKNGITSWGNWQQFPSTPAEVATNIPLTRTYVSSGTTGFRYEANLSQFDYVKAVVPSGVEWLCSWGMPDSGAQKFPADGVFKFKAGNNYLQIRPKTVTSLKPISVTGYKSGVATQSRVLPVKLAAGIYYLEIQNVKGGYSIKSSQITVK